MQLKVTQEEYQELQKLAQIVKIELKVLGRGA